MGGESAQEGAVSKGVERLLRGRLLLPLLLLLLQLLQLALALLLQP